MTGTRSGDARLGTEGLGPGAVIGGRYRLASVASRHGLDVLLNALDEQARQRVRVRVTAQAVDPAMAALIHPGIVPVVTHGVAGRWTYTVHPWFDGHPLHLEPRVRPTPALIRRCLRLTGEVLDALDHVHQTTARAHGNFGLHSLWMSDDGHPLIVDLAAPQGVLTPAALPYASPERLRGQPRTPSSDVYAAGAILFALLTGEPPFGTEPIDARSGHLLRPVPEVPELPPDVAALVDTALHKRPDQRFESAGHMRAAIDAILHEHGPGPTPVPLAGRGSETPSSIERLVPLVDDDSTMAGTLDPVPPHELAEVRRRIRRAFVVYAAGGLLLGAAAGLLLVLLLSSVGLVWWGASVEPATAALPTPTPVEGEVAEVAEVADIADPVSPPTPLWERAPVAFGYDSFEATPLQDFRDFERDVQQWDGDVLLTGHTDSGGSLRANYLMGLGRAWAVQQLLVVRGIEESRVPISSAGETRPVAPNTTRSGREQNRRVSVEFKDAAPTF